MKTDQKCPEELRNEETKANHIWVHEADVPTDWTEAKDRAYCLEYFGSDGVDPMVCRADLIKQIEFALENWLGALSFAIAYLQGRSWPEDDDVVRFMPVPAIIELLLKLLRERNSSRNYFERFEQDLENFLEVERLRVPILMRYLTAPDTVWVRELVHVRDALMASTNDFAESMFCEHHGCPFFLSVDRTTLVSKDTEPASVSAPPVCQMEWINRENNAPGRKPISLLRFPPELDRQ
ncbi:MAG: hypothetical protein L0387_30320 [Acidobacteria bacterium]|nr:hypothetical protein [Acidobacteriota bacterium]